MKFARELNIFDFFRCVNYNRIWRKEHPDELTEVGLAVFCGKQGEGKTLSMVKYVYSLLEKYKGAVLCSNVELADYPFNSLLCVKDDSVYLYYKANDYECYVDISNDMMSFCEFLFRNNLPRPSVKYEGRDYLTYLNNGEYGTIFCIDEIQLEWNSLDKGISIEEMIEFSQQRKQRKHIVGTSQVFGRLQKVLREQIKLVIACRKFGYLQINTYFDGQDTEEKDGKLVTSKARKYFYFHSPRLYQSYDTFAKMRRFGLSNLTILKEGVRKYEKDVEEDICRSCNRIDTNDSP